MRSQTILLAIVGLTACASAPTPAPAPDRVLAVNSDGSIVRRSTSDENFRTTFTAPPSRVWPALVSAYTTLGIQPTANNQATGQYGNSGFVVPRRIAGRNIADFFNCGSSITGPRIETGRVYGNVMSVLTPDGNGGSSLMTHVSATVRDNSGSASDPLPCESTGLLEQLLQKNVQQAVGTK